MNESTDNLLWDIWLSRLYLPALAVADELCLFENISKSNGMNELVLATGIPVQGVKAICYFMASLGFVSINNNVIELTDISLKYLIPSSRYYWRNAFVRTRESDDYIRILDAFRNKPGNLHSHGKNLSELWQNGLVDKKVAESFTKIMDCTIINSAELAMNQNIFSDVKNLLDIGGGSGCFSTLFANKYPTSFATIYELKSVCAYLEKSVVAENIHIQTGNFLTEDLPKNHDAILLSNILHDWNIDNVNKILKKCYDALENNGYIIINEMLLDNEFINKTSYAFNLLMYVNHGSQQFTRNEIKELLVCVGFIEIEFIPLGNYYTIIKGIKMVS
jgi:acetylserotonin N-methyltransferase